MLTVKTVSPVGNGAPRESPPMLVADIFTAYLRHAAAVGLHCPKSRADRIIALAGFQNANPGLTVEESKPFHLADWIESHAWASSTNRAKARAVHAAMNWAVTEGRIGRNPFAGVSYPEGDPRPCLEDHTLAALANLANKPFEPVLRFLRLTGCRPGEACKVCWEDIDWKRGLAVLLHHKTKKKTGRPRVIVLVPEAVALLDAVKAEPSSGTVFLNNRGRPWKPKALGTALLRLKAKHKIVCSTLHGIRHQFAHAALRAGENLSKVSKALGHASIGITDRFYGHLADDWEAIRGAACASAQAAGF